MMEGPAAARYQRDIMSRRNLSAGGKEMNRIYAVECAPTTIGVVAGRRIPLRASLMLGFAKALAARLGVAGVGATAVPAGVDEAWLNALAADLSANRGASVVVVGAHQPAEVHALGHAINEHLGNFGQTVVQTVTTVPSTGDITTLAGEMASGQIHALFILGGNPVYNTPLEPRFQRGAVTCGIQSPFEHARR